jgi:hypothetical protein
MGMFALFIQSLCERRHSPKKFSLRLVIGGVWQQGDFVQPWPLVRWLAEMGHRCQVEKVLCTHVYFSIIEVWGPCASTRSRNAPTEL